MQGSQGGMAASGALPAAIRGTVENMLSAQFGTAVRISGVMAFPYSRVMRCALEAAGSAVPPTVIARLRRDDPARSHPARLHNEQAALEFLTRSAAHSPHASSRATLLPEF